jgi:ubiquitin C-terminal hydrolase
LERQKKMMADILETQEQEEEPTSTSTSTAINNKMEDVIKLPTLTTTTTASDIFRPPPPKLYKFIFKKVKSFVKSRRIIGPPIYQKGVCGLLNLGNTCFMNRFNHYNLAGL